MRHARLPPAFQLVILPGTENPRNIALNEVLASGETADGLVLWRESGLRLDCVFAVHLEEGETASSAVDLMVVALVDTLAAVLPSSVSLNIVPTATVMLDGAPLAQIDIVGEDAAEGGAIGLAVDIPVAGQAFGTSLQAAGAVNLTTADLLEALAGHVLEWALRVDEEGPRLLWATLDARRIGKPH
ncbi:MAG: biotin/lipoate--protein ligase family protein [Geminicoccaceae bacterium]